MEFIEQTCTFNHEGRAFEAGGAWKVGNRAAVYIVPLTGDYAGRFKATDWHGSIIGIVRAHTIGPKRWTKHGYWRSAAVRVEIDKEIWYGSYNFDGGELVQLRVLKGRR